MNSIAYYINLEHAVERRQNITAELAQVFPVDNIVRVPAVCHSNGAYGLACSSLLMLQIAEQSAASLIYVFEDDHAWELGHAESRKILQRLEGCDFDLVLLSYHIPLVRLHTIRPPLAQIRNGQTASAYVFHRRFIPELRRVFTASRDNLLSQSSDDYAIDQIWKELQGEQHKTYGIIPRLGKQREGYSSIEKRIVSYGGGCFMIILSCQKYADRRASQDLSQCPFPYRYFIGDSSLETATEREDVVMLPCGDGYEDLPLKTYQALLYVRNTYPLIDWIFKTDDDIAFDFEELYLVYSDLYLKGIPYAGNVVHCTPHLSTYHYGKCNDKSREVPFQVSQSMYCSGGGYFLNKKATEICLNSATTYNTELFEDLATGLALNRAGINPVHLPFKERICRW
ncbi:MAG: hypothetical protein ACYCOU_03475 [Sulfobacillus sp.]